MAWKESFAQAVSSFKASRLEESLHLFTQAIERGGSRSHNVYDSRAAVYEKQGKTKEALKDARRVIELAPARWQGYARAARLFQRVRKLEEALTMATMALERVKPDDAKRRVELQSLRDDVLDQRRRLACHFGKLPVEIFAEIFEMVVEPDWTGVLLVSAVSRRWRDIAMATPSLWNTLVLTGKDPVGKSSRWLARSKGRIRELCVFDSAFSHLDWSIQKLKDLQWNRLRILRLPDIGISAGMHNLILSLVELRELDVGGGNCAVDCKSLAMTDGALQSLTFNGEHYQSWDAIPFTTLTSFVVRNTIFPCDPARLLTTLGENIGLETLIFENITGRYETANDSVQLLSLTHLELDRLGYGMTYLFLEQLLAPSLRVLILSRLTAGLDGSLMTLTRRGSLNLTQLTIRACFVRAKPLIDFLHSTTALQSLEISNISDTANFVLEALAAPVHGTSGVDPLCPALTHLNVSDCPDVKTGPLLRLVKSRNCETSPPEDDSPPTPPSPAPIASIIVDGCPQIQADTLPWFRQKLKVFSCVYMSKKAARWKR